MGCNSSSTAVDRTIPHKNFDGYVLPQECERKAESMKQGSECRFHENYLLGKKLGKGAFAQVYIGQKVNKPDAEAVAVKIMDNRMLVNGEPVNKVDSQNQEAIDNEVEILSRISLWDGCVKMHTAYTEGLFCYIVMEKCEMTMLRCLDKMDLTEATLVDLLRGALTSLCCIAAVDVVHRDVKPDNYLVKNGVVKLCDFGMSEVVEKNTPGVKGVFGTAPYMCPEMLKGQAYDQKADVWSWAVMAYVLFFGKFPYQPKELTSKSMKAAIVTGDQTLDFHPKPGLPRVSECVCEYLRSVLVRDPEQRPTAMVAMASYSDARGCDGYGSLRPMLYAAKREGAFNSPKLEGSENSMDTHVRYLQGKYHGKSSSRVGKVRSMKCKGRAVADISSMVV